MCSVVGVRKCVSVSGLRRLRQEWQCVRLCVPTRIKYRHVPRKHCHDATARWPRSMTPLSTFLFSPLAYTPAPPIVHSPWQSSFVRKQFALCLFSLSLFLSLTLFFLLLTFSLHLIRWNERVEKWEKSKGNDREFKEFHWMWNNEENLISVREYPAKA